MTKKTEEIQVGDEIVVEAVPAEAAGEVTTNETVVAEAPAEEVVVDDDPQALVEAHNPKMPGSNTTVAKAWLEDPDGGVAHGWKAGHSPDHVPHSKERQAEDEAAIKAEQAKAQQEAAE